MLDRRVDEAFAGIAVPRRQTPHHQEIDRQIEVTGNRLAIGADPASERRRVEQQGLIMGEPRPEPLQCFSWHARPELRDVAFDSPAEIDRLIREFRSSLCYELSADAPRLSVETNSLE